MDTLRDVSAGSNAGAIRLPWTERAAAAWLRGEPVADAPEDWPAVEAAARALVTDKITRLLEESERPGPWEIRP
jgi:hypothetical protein